VNRPFWARHAAGSKATARLALLLLLATLAPQPTSRAAEQGGAPLPHPILFVTQMPIGADFATIGSVFANHTAGLQEVGRGGDLWIRYPDGTRRNLTQEAGFGTTGFQGANAISVRNPSVHWNGTKAVFSMVIGAPTQQFQVQSYRWQLYEVTGLGQGQTAVITPVPNQPADFNNVMPIYGTDGRILFVSDRPRDGSPHLYPQLDEYESTATNTGLWSLDPATGDLRLLNHSPSGVFNPSLDRYGRVIFTRWDHLQRDQQADADATSGDTYGTFNYASEAANAARLPVRTEIYPEPRPSRTDLLAGTNLEGHTINHFFPWQINEDGTEEETLNHIGRHELHGYFNRSLNDDANLDEFIAEVSGRVNPREILNFLHVRESVVSAGTYFGVEGPEFTTHSSGQIISVAAAPTAPPHQMTISYITHPLTATVVDEGQNPPAGHTGHYRSPLPLTDGRALVVHTAETHRAGNDGTRANPDARYDFRLKLLESGPDGYQRAGANLQAAITKTLSYFDPDVLVSYSGPLWELDPVEVRPRTVPPRRVAQLPAPERTVFLETGVDPRFLQQDLAARGLALFTARNATYRDALDLQQPFNLRVPGGEQTLGAGGKIYDIAHLQLFQGDQIRGMGGTANPRAGRRVLAQLMHEPAALALNPPNPNGPPASAKIAPDGSVAAFVPTRRALSWQVTAPNGTPVVRERYWITFQPGEIRTCDGCHGVNAVNQAGEAPASQPPQALRDLILHWKQETGAIFSDGFEAGDTSAWSTVGN
jgi:hypothetical protein